MLTLHHLSDSRSQRTLWLLEELGLPYRLVRYQRVPEAMAAPPEMKALHPIGKAPILEDDGLRMVESGAIAHYILSRYGDGGLAPAPGDADYMRYLELLEIGVASGMTPVLLSVYARMAGLPTGELDAAAEREYALVLGYLESILARGPWPPPIPTSSYGWSGSRRVPHSGRRSKRAALSSMPARPAGRHCDTGGRLGRSLAVGSLPWPA
ncbi:glutathione S-transferase family protein [Sphingomonas oryzagri]